MSILEIFLIALGLAMDAFAVAVANGVIIYKVKIKHALIFGLYFGFFQFIMPIIGWLIGMSFANIINNIDHWIAFILLVFIGGNMIIESLKQEKEEVVIRTDKEIIKWRNMIMLAIATSIDAMAVGVSFAVIETDILLSSIIIGIVAFILSALGVLIGKKLGKLFKKGAEIAGGIILILIGIKILVEHFFF